MTEALRQRSAKAGIADQEITPRPGHIADFEHGCLRAKKAAHMANRPQPRAAHDAERDNRGRVAVHHRNHIRPTAVDLAVDESLQIHRRPSRLDRSRVEIERKHVLSGDQRGRHASGEQKLIGPNGMTHG